MADALDRGTGGRTRSAMPRCGGILKSATVMFGKVQLPGMFERPATAAARCDLLVAIGSALAVQPARRPRQPGRSPSDFSSDRGATFLATLAARRAIADVVDDPSDGVLLHARHAAAAFGSQGGSDQAWLVAAGVAGGAAV